MALRMLDQCFDSKRLPDLASSLTLSVPNDNPALHQGRVRSSPHVEGQFAAYVYVPVKLTTTGSLYSLLYEAVKHAEQLVPIIHPIAVTKDPGVAATEAETDLHISLTRPIYLRAHQREEFKIALKRVAKVHARSDLMFVPHTRALSQVFPSGSMHLLRPSQNSQTMNVPGPFSPWRSEQGTLRSVQHTWCDAPCQHLTS